MSVHIAWRAGLSTAFRPYASAPPGSATNHARLQARRATTSLAGGPLYSSAAAFPISFACTPDSRRQVGTPCHGSSYSPAMNINCTLVTCAALGLLPLACDSGTTATTDTGAIATDGSMVGITTSNDPSAPHIIAFSTNVASISDGELVNFTAVVTDPDGIEDLIGGTLEGETGAVFGSFTTTAQEGAYSLGLSWGQINQVEPIEFAAGEGTTRVFTARFYDQSSLQTAAEVTIALACDDVLLGACDGSCIDTQESVQHCGACGFACAEIAGCCEGVCVEVGADPVSYTHLTLPTIYSV